MWLCLESLFVWIRKKKQGISVILLICLNDTLSTRYSTAFPIHPPERAVGSVMCVCDLSLIWAAVTVMFLSFPHCPSAFPPQSHCHLAAVTRYLCPASALHHTHAQHTHTHILCYRHQMQVRIKKACWLWIAQNIRKLMQESFLFYTILIQYVNTWSDTCIYTIHNTFIISQ